MFYERLTKRGDDHALHVFDINDREISLSEVTALDIDLIAGRLAELEDKIESGEIDYDDAIETEQKINDLLVEFDEMGFAPTTLHPDPEQYAIDWRDQVRKEFARLTAERDDYKSRAEAAEQEATSWKDCANK